MGEPRLWCQTLPKSSGALQITLWRWKHIHHSLIFPRRPVWTRLCYYIKLLSQNAHNFAWREGSSTDFCFFFFHYHLNAIITIVCKSFVCVYLLIIFVYITHVKHLFLIIPSLWKRCTYEKIWYRIITCETSDVGITNVWTFFDGRKISFITTYDVNNIESELRVGAHINQMNDRSVTSETTFANSL